MFGDRHIWRHPEVMYRARPATIAHAAELQARLLDRALAWLKPGGTLVYSVCSLERVEGEDVIAAFMQRNGGVRVDLPTGLPSFVPVGEEGWVRILPGLIEADGGLDGFFMARLVRTS